MKKLKVLWFAVTPSLYSTGQRSHNGGGWIASLEKIVREESSIELGVAFEHPDKIFRVQQDGVTYYPINREFSKFEKLKNKIVYTPEETWVIPQCLKIIEDFKPDVIHVFGSEWCFGLLVNFTKIPVVIHMQGSLPAYYNAYYPPGYSRLDVIKYVGLNLKRQIQENLKIKTFISKSKREEKILKSCNYFMGRTEWDHAVTRVYSPQSKYYYCAEALRESFFNIHESWKPNNHTCCIISSTLSHPTYKGFDLILKTALILKNHLSVSFEWQVFGVNEVDFHEWKTGIKSSEVNVRLMGVVSAEKLKNHLLDSDVYVHPSYIENSPNSICEAQLIGVPVICTNVGGVSSLVQHSFSGFLVPANDPYQLSYSIKKITNDKLLASRVSENARKVAIERNNVKLILSELINIYKSIIS